MWKCGIMNCAFCDKRTSEDFGEFLAFWQIKPLIFLDVRSVGIVMVWSRCILPFILGMSDGLEAACAVSSLKLYLTTVDRAK